MAAVVSRLLCTQPSITVAGTRSAGSHACPSPLQRPSGPQLRADYGRGGYGGGYGGGEAAAALGCLHVLACVALPALHLQRHFRGGAVQLQLHRSLRASDHVHALPNLQATATAAGMAATTAAGATEVSISCWLAAACMRPLLRCAAATA